MKILLYSIHDYANIGIRMLGAYLSKHGHDVRLCFLGSEHGLMVPDALPRGYLSSLDSRKDLTCIVRPEGQLNLPLEHPDIAFPDIFGQLLQHVQPDIVGFSCRSILTPYFTDWFQQIRTVVPGVFLVAGGYGPTLEPQTYLDRGVNAVVCGEGEEALLELAECHAAGLPWRGLRNLVYFDEGKLVANPLRPAIRDLDALPPPMAYCRGIYYVQDARCMERDPLPLNPASVLLSRGCIGSCGYCSSGHWRDLYKSSHVCMPKYRYPSNEHYLQNLSDLKRLGARSIRIQDDFFIRPYSMLHDFFVRYKEEINLPFTCYLHLPFIKRHPDILHLALDAGMARVEFPIQSADPEVNRRLFNRETDLEAVLEFARYASSRFVPFFTHFIDGFRTDDVDIEKYLQDNLDFITRLPSFHPGFPNLIIYVTTFLRLHLNSPLHINGLTQPIPFAHFVIRSMLMLFRHILDDKSFDAVKDRYIEDREPEPLLAMYNRLKGELHNAYMVEQANKFAGEDCLVWGCGDVYEQRKPLLLGMRPRGIVTDVSVSDRYVDGMSVIPLDEILTGQERPPIFICVRDPQPLARKLKSLCPDYPAERIIGFGCSS